VKPVNVQKRTVERYYCVLRFKICCSTSISTHVFTGDDAGTEFHVGLRNQLYKGKVEYPASVLLVLDCVRLYDDIQHLIAVEGVLSAAAVSQTTVNSLRFPLSLDFTLPHSVRRSKVRGKVSHVALQRESYTVTVSWMSSKT
jgi:hypothetical protein